MSLKPDFINGAGKESIEIGGLDLPVVKHPGTGAPYIPGSSLKGKMRFLNEWKENLVESEAVHKCPDPSASERCYICRVFGTTEKSNKRGPTRLIVRDAHIKGEFDAETMLEVKWENTINRVTGTAVHPRPRERVTAGTEFEFEMIFRIFDSTDKVQPDDLTLFKKFLRSFEMLEHDTIGGSGSRGCGKIEFKDITITGGNGNAGFDSKSSELPVA